MMMSIIGMLQVVGEMVRDTRCARDARCCCAARARDAAPLFARELLATEGIGFRDGTDRAVIGISYMRRILMT
jgi:hypothetical protein